MRKHRKVIAILCVSVMLAGVAGCASGTPEDPVSVSEWGVDGGVLREKTFKTSDGRRVQCLTYNRGLSCDWVHADGSDKEES